MRIIVSGGGTGGHIYPAITLINEIKRRRPDAEFLYVGTSDGLEADIIPKEDIPFSTVDIHGFERKLTPVNLWRAIKAGVGTLEAILSGGFPPMLPSAPADMSAALYCWLPLCLVCLPSFRSRMRWPVSPTSCWENLLRK